MLVHVYQLFSVCWRDAVSPNGDDGAWTQWWWCCDSGTVSPPPLPSVASQTDRLRSPLLQIRIWDVKTGKPIGDAMRGHSKWVTSLAWEPAHLASTTAPRLASSSKDGTVRVWSLATRRTAYALGGHTACVNVVKWGGEGLLYTASSDRTVRVWNAEDGKLVRSLNDHAHWVTTMALSNDHVLRTGPFGTDGKKGKDDEECECLIIAPLTS